MGTTTPVICFKGALRRPALPQPAAWTFLVLPRMASAKLPSRSMVSVDCTLDGYAFQVTLEPDGEGGHWLKVDDAVREAAGIEVGVDIDLTMTPLSSEPEPAVPADLRAALDASDAALAIWQAITPLARRDWIHWITSGKKAETRVKRIATACDMLASGKRRACCFDRSGMYSRGSMGPPQAAP